jgi:hypothetical protein
MKIVLTAKREEGGAGSACRCEEAGRVVHASCIIFVFQCGAVIEDDGIMRFISFTEDYIPGL